MSTWLTIVLSILALGAATFFLGEWLCRLLIPHFAPKWRLRDTSRPDPLADDAHRRDEG